MIRIFRAHSHRELKFPVGEAPIAQLRALEELDALSDRVLSPGEREAIRRAVAIHGSLDVNVLLAANGTVFRVEKGASDRGALTPPAAPVTNWLTTERGAPVLVATGDDRWDARAVAALRFLGYAARRAERSAVETIMTAPPLAAIVLGAHVTEELILAASDRCAIVAIVPPGTMPPTGVHASFERPLRLAGLATKLDPLIRKSRSGRLRLGKPTPRP